LIYGCEIWEYEDLQIIETLHLKFLKHILRLKSSTPSCMVYGETGRFPLYIYVYTRMISYWAKLTSGNENKIVHILYKYSYTQYRNGEFKIQLSTVEHKVCKHSLSIVFMNVYRNGQPAVRSKFCFHARKPAVVG
jgi:hypothetical protein